MDGLVAWMLSWWGCQHGRYHRLGMDALANEWAGGFMEVIMVGLVAWTLSCLGHACTGQWMDW